MSIVLVSLNILAEVSAISNKLTDGSVDSLD